MRVTEKLVEEWVLAPFQEPGPDSDDPEVMAQWHEREAAALNLLCGHAWLGGDRDNADLMAQEAAGLSMAAGRLRGTVIVAPDIHRAALEAMGQRGAVGIRLNWFRRALLPDPTSAEYRRLFATVRDLGWHVEIYIEGPKLAALLPQIRDTGTNVVVDHFGGPDPARGVACAGFQRVLEGVRAGDTFVKLSASYRQGGADCQPYVDALLDAGGPQRLVWASDWPFLSHEDHVTYEDCVNDLNTWVPDTATRHVILAETPAKLFGFDRAVVGPNSFGRGVA